MGQSMKTAERELNRALVALDCVQKQTAEQSLPFTSAHKIDDKDV